MITIARIFTQFLCEICGRTYLKEYEAVECENTHYVPVEIKKFDYDFGDDKFSYPMAIRIKLKNKKGIEKIVEYKRK